MATWLALEAVARGGHATVSCHRLAAALPPGWLSASSAHRGLGQLELLGWIELADEVAGARVYRLVGPATGTAYDR